MQLPTDQSMSSLTTLGQDLYDAEECVLQAEANLKTAKKIRDAIATQSIPELMREMKLESLTMTGGRKVEVKEILSVTPKAADRPLVLQAIAAQGAGVLIKTTLSIPFGRGQDDEVKRINEMLQAEGLTTKVDTKIESSTLKKHVRERLEAGKPVDMKLFGVRQFDIAKFTAGAPTAPVFPDE